MFKRLNTALSAFTLLASVLLSTLVPLTATAVPTNLIANPSVETANAAGTAPLNWQTDAWGKNTSTFQYKAMGYQSNRSVYVEMANYTSGDAKWFFDPVVVSSNTDYTFSETYESTVKTRLVAMSIDGAGTASYFDVNVSVPVAAAWTNYSVTVHTLASTKSLTILHLIKNNGWLMTDNFSLNAPDGTTPPVVPPVVPPVIPPVVPPVTPPATGIVPNASVETAGTKAGQPANWTGQKWGNNTPTYDYVLNDGHAGSRSVKVTMNNYKTGDAKWVFTPQALTRGADYRFTAWYKTNTVPHVVAQYEKDDGTEDFFGLPDPEPAANSATTWQQYSDTFGVPKDVKAVTLFFFLSNNGWVQTDDYNISPYTYTGFNSGMVSLVFDDGFEENVTTALPTLDKYGFKTTHCFATQYVEGKPAKVKLVQQIANDGNEICAHTVTHPWLTQMTVAQQDYELQHSRDYLRSIVNQPVNDFASPYGDYNAAVNTEIAKYYQSHRTTDEGYNSKDNFNAYRLRVQNMAPTTTLAQFQGWINKAKADHTWLILIYHVINPNKATLDEFDTYKPDFDAQMQWLSTAGLPVVRWDNALTQLKAQL